jgi:hypothetical protein
VRRALLLILLALAGGLGLGLGLRLVRREPPLPDPPAVAVRIREVARLETLDVALYKKVTFSPDPAPGETLWSDVAGWLRHAFRTPRGKAIVFADAHLGLDLAKLEASSVRVVGREVWLVLPPVRVSVELRPGETEIIGSNLDSAETAKLLALAHDAFVREVESDRALQGRARASAERQIGALLATLGFTAIHFVDALPGLGSS